MHIVVGHGVNINEHNPDGCVREHVQDSSTEFLKGLIRHDRESMKEMENCSENLKGSMSWICKVVVSRKKNLNKTTKLFHLFYWSKESLSFPQRIKP